MKLHYAKILPWLKKTKSKALRPTYAYVGVRDGLERSQQVAQVLLSLKYKGLLDQQAALPRFEDVEFRVFSQNGEDGILLYIFSLIGTTNKKCIEICAEDGIQCNTANLIVNHGWIGLLFDGSRRNIKRGERFYERCADTGIWPPTLVQAWISAENVNRLISANGFGGEIDLLSLDIDGNDYWVWKAIECIHPRVVVLEYNPLLGPDLTVTIPYKADFVAEAEDLRHTNYYGASLAAFVKLGIQKGYRLVGCERLGYNAFFIRNDIGQDIFPEVSSSTCFEHPYAQYATNVRRTKIVEKKWIEV